jgi:non-ribosomal peptide synthetase component E (peptide arylation enzyme)
MIETELFLDVSVRGTIDANGRATVTTGPDNAQERWVIKNQSASGPFVAKLTVYRGQDTSRQIDVTVRADNDSSDTVIPVKRGEKVTFQWSGGTVGAVMMVHLEGQRFIQGQRGY